MDIIQLVIREELSKSSKNIWLIDIMKGICAIWVIMLHSIPGGYWVNKLLLMPFYAQLTIPFFMTLTGFAYAISYERTKNWWNLSNLKKKCIRVIVPFVPALIFELLVVGLPEKPVRWILSGGYTFPGSYYVVLLPELFILFPLVEKFGERTINRKKRNGWFIGLLEVFILQCFYELLTYWFHISGEVYRFLIFRYMIYIYGGVVIYKYFDDKKGNISELQKVILWIDMIKIMPIGFIFIIIIGYLGYQPQIIFRYDTWFRSSAPTAFWVIPIVAFLIAHMDSFYKYMDRTKKRRKVVNILALCGRSSYQIYIVQMLWFGIVAGRINTGLFGGLDVFVISVVICIIFGIMYYYLEFIIRNKYIINLNFAHRF